LVNSSIGWVLGTLAGIFIGERTMKEIIETLFIYAVLIVAWGLAAGGAYWIIKIVTGG